MSGKIELNALLDLALGQQAEGAVNFKVLHGFLKNILGHLSLSNVEVDVNDFEYDKPSNDGMSSIEIKSERDFTKAINGKNEVLSQYNGAVEKRVCGLEDRLKLLDSFSATDDILKWAKGQEDSKSKIADMWNFMNMQKRIEATENGVKKISSVVDKILLQLKNVSDLQERMYNMEKRMEELGTLQQQLDQLAEKMKYLDDAKRIDDLLQQLNDMRDRIGNMPLLEDLQMCVKWPQLQSALETGKLNTDASIDDTFGSTSGEDSSPILSSAKSDSSKQPSPKVVNTLGKLGKIIPEHKQLKDEVEKLKSMLDTKASLEDLENLSSKEIPDDLVSQLAQLNGDVGELKLWKDEVDEDRTKLSTMRTSLDDLENAVESLQNTMKHVVEEHSRKQKHIDELYSLGEKLKDSKMDKDDVILQLNLKADKTDFDNFVSRQRFDTNITRIDDLLKELIDKFRSSDETLNKMIAKIINDLEGKIDRDELKELKDYLDSRLKALKARQREEPTMDDDPAALFKKAMLQFNCLSCDRPVYFSANGPMQSYSGMPMQKSTRPYTTYELDQLRMLQKGSLKPDSNDYSTYRSCGGSHTSSSPVRRISAKLNSYVSSYEEVPVPTQTVRSEVDIQGQDGKLYKGRVDKNEEFPDVNRRQTQNGRMKPKSAHAGMRSSSATNSPEATLVPRRPKTAIHRCPTPDPTDRSTPDRPERPTPDRSERPQTARLRTPSPDITSMLGIVDDRGATEIVNIS